MADLSSLFPDEQEALARPAEKSVVPGGAMRPALAGLLMMLAMAGLIISSVLAVQSWMQIDLPGCAMNGPGCGQVLGTGWSRWFGVPVSVMATGLYALLLVLLLVQRASSSAFVAVRVWFVLLVGGAALCGAAIWFIGLQVFVVGQLCKWCMAAHLVGLTFGHVIYFAAPVSLRGDSPDRPLRPFTPAAIGLAFVALIAGGQLIGASDESEPTEIRGDVVPAVVPRSGGPGLLRVLANDQWLNLAATTDPVDLGPPVVGLSAGTTQPSGGAADELAGMTVVMFFDYTCAHCRRIHGYFEDVMRRHPGMRMVELVIPRDADCNPRVDPTMQPPEAEHACELARLSLAAWRADPARYPEVSRLLWGYKKFVTPDAARQAVAEVIGDRSLARALADPWVNERLVDNQRLVLEMTDRAILPIFAFPHHLTVGAPKDEVGFKAILDAQRTASHATAPAP
ncbi:MAG: hypothetical protein IT442_12995 [Phycisphaeraceae bacterium]|nr:hypothetical protein [Phycisphaeraceae bacterium]